MSAALLVFTAFVFLAAFNAGAMTTLQIQHYAIYPLVGRDGFAAYLRANNRAAVVPVIVPALLLLIVTLLLIATRPPFMRAGEAAAAFALNLVQLASTAIWQRKLQAEMAVSGYDEAKTRQLVTTNWIRTVAFLLQALLAMAIVIRGIGTG
jgi:hypothetical protein